jgi:hypothetical protein
MTKTEQLKAVADRLSDEQIGTLLSFAHAMADAPFYETAPPEALASLDRGLRQLERGEGVPLEELSERLAVARRSQT